MCRRLNWRQRWELNLTLKEGGGNQLNYQQTTTSGSNSRIYSKRVYKVFLYVFNVCVWRGGYGKENPRMEAMLASVTFSHTHTHTYIPSHRAWRCPCDCHRHAGPTGLWCHKHVSPAAPPPEHPRHWLPACSRADQTGPSGTLRDPLATDGHI